MKIDGRCHCGCITYEAEIDPKKVMIFASTPGTQIGFDAPAVKFEAFWRV